MASRSSRSAVATSGCTVRSFRASAADAGGSGQGSIAAPPPPGDGTRRAADAAWRAKPSGPKKRRRGAVPRLAPLHLAWAVSSPGVPPSQNDTPACRLSPRHAGDCLPARVRSPLSLSSLQPAGGWDAQWAPYGPTPCRTFGSRPRRGSIPRPSALLLSGRASEIVQRRSDLLPQSPTATGEHGPDPYAVSDGLKGRRSTARRNAPGISRP